MSVRIMSLIFEAEMPDLEYEKDGEKHKAKASTVKLLLLSYADHANDEGEASYPGYTRLEKKTALSRQGISDTLEAIRQNGLMTLVGKSKNETNTYTINIEKLKSLVKPLDQQKQEVVKPLDQHESSHLTGTGQATGLKPSSTVIKTIHSEKFLKDANRMVDAVLEANEKAKSSWQGRESMPEFLRDFGDEFVKCTRIKPSKKELSFWLAEFSDWHTFGVNPSDIQEGYAYSRSHGFDVFSPASLTKTLRMLVAKREAGVTDDPYAGWTDYTGTGTETPVYKPAPPRPSFLR